MSLIAYMPSVVKGRYVHFSYSGQSCAIRDFIATGDMPIRDYRTSQAQQLIAHHIAADRVPITDVSFWVKRLAEYSFQKLGNVAVLPEARQAYSNTERRIEPKIANTLSLTENSFKAKKPAILFYGERGIVNTLFMELADNKGAFSDFIAGIKKVDGSRLYDGNINSYSIVIEPDFGKVGYGTTDAVIVINNSLLIFFEAKRKSFAEIKDELTYQIELNYVLANHLVNVANIPSEVSLEPKYSSSINTQRGTRGGSFRKLYINDEHKFFFGDFVKCSSFSCTSLTTDRNQTPLYEYYKNSSAINYKDLSWIGYKEIKDIANRFNLVLTQAHLEMNRRHLGYVG